MEAAFVVPMVLGIIFALMYVLFWGHDKLVAYGNMRSGILKCAINGEELPEQSQWRSEIQSNLWMGKVVDGDISENALRVKGSAKIELQLQIPVLNIFMEDKQEIRCEDTWESWQPAQVVRLKGK